MTTRRTFITGLMASAAAPVLPAPANPLIMGHGWYLSIWTGPPVCEPSQFGLLSLAAMETDRRNLRRELSGITDLMLGRS